MNRKWIKFFFFAIFFFFPFSGESKSEKIGISVNRTIFDLNLLPNDSAEINIEIKNITSENQRVSIDFRDLTIEDQNQIMILENKNEIFGMKDWLVFEEEVFILEPNQKREIKINLNVPVEAIVGSHFSTIFVRSLPEVEFDNFQKVIVSGEIGVYVFCNVGGDVLGKGLIEDLITPRLVDKKANMSVVFKNLGNVHYIPHGEIEIKNILTREKEEHKLDSHFVFPGKTYSFDYQWRVPSVFSLYFVRAFFVDHDGQTLKKETVIFGKYFFVSLLFIFLLLFFFSRNIFLKHKKNKRINENKKSI